MHISEVIESLQAQIIAKKNWLETFGWGPKKRPDHEISVKERETKALEEAVRRLKKEAG